jgi:formylglycine-generating enzyme required for sulfatase activity
VNATKPVIVATAKSVAVDGILVRTTEVTQAEYEAVTGSNPACYKDYRRPVEQVSWYDAIRFCNLLSVRDGLTPCYSVKGSTNVDTWTDYSADDVEWNKAANGWRLPTEEEWVKAADDGHEYSGSDDIDDVAWYSGNSDSETHDVADKKANANGLYDMSGNVEEWCWDFYNDSFFYRDPSDRVYRGGSCDSHADDCAVSVRGHYFPGDRSSDLGFRIVRSSSAK